MELKTVKIKNPDALNLILGQSHFIKTVEDIYEAMVNSVPGVKFGVAFCEASDVCLIRTDGTDEELIKLATENAEKLSAGHTFIIFMRDIFPINVLPAIKNVVEVTGIHCATANPVEVIIAETEQGRGVMGVIDGFASKGVESEEDVEKRYGLLRAIQYKK